jgi:hypothetical protein
MMIMMMMMIMMIVLMIPVAEHTTRREIRVK